MKQIVALLALVALTAGCFGNGQTGATEDAGANPDIVSPDGNLPILGPPETFAVDAFVASDGAAMAEAFDCVTPAPEGCDLWGTVNYEVTGTWNGLMIDRAHATIFPDGSFVVVGDLVFTGMFEGCGSGTMTLRYTGAGGDADLDHPGHVLGYDDAVLVPGSTTMGLAGVTEAQIKILYHISPVNFASEGTVEGSITCSPIVIPSPASHEGATAIPIEATWTSAGFAGPDQFACVPGRPYTPPCELYGTLMIDLEGSIAGSMTDIFHFHYVPTVAANVPLEAAGYRLFTGTLDGCGSGSLALRLEGTGVVEPNLADPGKLHLLEPTMTLVPGSLSTGFAAIVDFELTLEFNMTPDTHSVGTAFGTVWCTAPVDSSTSHEGARAIEIQSTIFAAGALYPDASSCEQGPPPVCETYFTLLVDLKGNMQGNFLDVFHMHATPDHAFAAVAERLFAVSIEGCGSGTFSLHLDGTTTPIEPSAAHPGFIHFREPAMTLVPGSTTTGFANLVDVVLTAEGDFTGNGYFAYGTVTGTVWCR